MNNSHLKLLITSLVLFITILFVFLINPTILKKIEQDDGFSKRLFCLEKDKCHKDVDGVDMKPYMNRLQKQIKKKWYPPNLNVSKKVVVKFRVLRNGDLLNYKIIQSSNDKKTDIAAIKALKLAAPFEPLPKEWKPDFADIEFDFDYNVFEYQKGYKAQVF